MASAQIAERGFVTELEGAGGPQRVTRAGLRFNNADAGPRSPAPALSADTDHWLMQLGYDAPATAALRAQGVV